MRSSGLTRHRRRRIPIIAVLVWLAAVALGSTASAVIPAQIVLKAGDAVGGSTVASLNSPFTDGTGRVGFVGALADSRRFIWYDTAPIFFSSDALPDSLTGGESTMGVSDAGGFIYSPSFNGKDAVYTHAGKLLAAGDVCPPLPNLYSSFSSRPVMLPNAYVYWIAGTKTTPGGTTSNRHLFKATDVADPSTIVRILGGGDIIDGKEIRTTASNFNFGISDNDQHHVHVLDMNVALNDHLYLDGVFVAQEGGPAGDDSWVSFTNPAVNDLGHYVFSATTSAPTTSNVVLAYDGVIGMTEGGTYDGVTLQNGYGVRAASISNLGQVACIWGVGATPPLDEHLFWSPGSDFSMARHRLATGDQIDTNGDNLPDYTVTDFSASSAVGPGLDLGPDGFIYVDVTVQPDGGPPIQAIIRVVGDPALSAVHELSGYPGTRMLNVQPSVLSNRAEVLYRLPVAGPVSLGVYDLGGRQLRLLDRGSFSSGEHRLCWDGRDQAGRRLPSGTYFLRLQAKDLVQSARVVVVR
jgi:hypothetical protein